MDIVYYVESEDEPIIVASVGEGSRPQVGDRVFLDWRGDDGRYLKDIMSANYIHTGIVYGQKEYEVTSVRDVIVYGYKADATKGPTAYVQVFLSEKADA